jgi:hypothetical protein
MRLVSCAASKKVPNIDTKLHARLRIPTHSSHNVIIQSTPDHLLLLRIPRFLISINMPNHVIRQPINTIPGPLRHLCEALRLGLVLERIAWEVDPRPMDIRFEDDVDAADAVERYHLVRVFVPVPHFGHVFAVRVVFFVAFGKDHVFGEGGGEFETFGGFLPGVVVD